VCACVCLCVRYAIHAYIADSLNVNLYISRHGIPRRNWLYPGVPLKVEEAVVMGLITDCLDYIKTNKLNPVLLTDRGFTTIRLLV
jgi:hypothetical protein